MLADAEEAEVPRRVSSTAFYNVFWARKYHEGKLAPLEELAHGTPIELDFNLQHCDHDGFAANGPRAAAQGSLVRSPRERQAKRRKAGKQPAAKTAAAVAAAADAPGAISNDQHHPLAQAMLMVACGSAGALRATAHAVAGAPAALYRCGCSAGSHTLSTLRHVTVRPVCAAGSLAGRSLRALQRPLKALAGAGRRLRLPGRRGRHVGAATAAAPASTGEAVASTTAGAGTPAATAPTEHRRRLRLALALPRVPRFPRPSAGALVRAPLRLLRHSGTLARRLLFAPAVRAVVQPHRLALSVLSAATGCARVGAAALLCSFFPKWCKLVGVCALFSSTQPVLGLLRMPVALPPAVRAALLPLAPLRGPLAAFGVMRVAMPLLMPGMWRNIMYWQRTMPIMTRYVRTSRRARKLQAAGCSQDAEELWQQQHERGAGEIFDMLCELKGFYLKLGQILAAKSDMLPPAYTASLSRLLDRLPPVGFGAVRAAVRRELGAPLEELFGSVDPFPLASATIAQVHKATLPDGRPVAVKVQHRSARRMMRGDLANLAALSGLMSAARFELGFDHGSLVREYNLQVPLEFDFVREAAVATLIRQNLSRHAAQYPLLRRVVVPSMVPSHSSTRVLTMEYLDGVPLLDIAGMDATIKQQLMAALVLAFGVMILRDGLFHSDPHPGNVMAMRARAGSAEQAALAQEHVGVVVTGELQVALLDFGQVKELPAASRARYALLVAALASRDAELLRATMGELGLRIEGCSEDFAATACYILFDTRMDFPEAFLSPLDPEAHEFRTTKVPALPQDLFMIMRTITLLRGLLSTLGVDVSSALLWRPLALQTLADLTPSPRPALRAAPPTAAAGAGAPQALARAPAAGSGRGSPVAVRDLRSPERVMVRPGAAAAMAPATPPQAAAVVGAAAAGVSGALAKKRSPLNAAVHEERQAAAAAVAAAATGVATAAAAVATAAAATELGQLGGAAAEAQRLLVQKPQEAAAAVVRQQQEAAARQRQEADAAAARQQQEAAAAVARQQQEAAVATAAAAAAAARQEEEQRPQHRQQQEPAAKQEVAAEAEPGRRQQQEPAAKQEVGAQAEPGRRQQAEAAALRQLQQSAEVRKLQEQRTMLLAAKQELEGSKALAQQPGQQQQQQQQLLPAAGGAAATGAAAAVAAASSGASSRGAGALQQQQQLQQAAQTLATTAPETASGAEAAATAARSSSRANAKMDAPLILLGDTPAYAAAVAAAAQRSASQPRRPSTAGGALTSALMPAAPAAQQLQQLQQQQQQPMPQAAAFVAGAPPSPLLAPGTPPRLPASGSTSGVGGAAAEPPLAAPQDMLQPLQPLQALQLQGSRSSRLSADRASTESDPQMQELTRQLVERAQALADNADKLAGLVAGGSGTNGAGVELAAAEAQRRRSGAGTAAFGGATAEALQLQKPLQLQLPPLKAPSREIEPEAAGQQQQQQRPAALLLQQGSTGGPTSPCAPFIARTWADTVPQQASPAANAAAARGQPASQQQQQQQQMPPQQVPLPSGASQAAIPSSPPFIAASWADTAPSMFGSRGTASAPATPLAGGAAAASGSGSGMLFAAMPRTQAQPPSAASMQTGSGFGVSGALGPPQGNSMPAMPAPGGRSASVAVAGVGMDLRAVALRQAASASAGGGKAPAPGNGSGSAAGSRGGSPRSSTESFKAGFARLGRKIAGGFA